MNVAVVFVLLVWRTRLVFPVFVWMYIRLARSEEHNALKEFGEVYTRYAEHTPGFIPWFGRSVEASQ